MGIVLTDDKHYKAIAEVIKEFPGSPLESYFPEDMANAIHIICSKERENGFGVGKIEGIAEAEAKCAAKHFSAIITGDGTETLTFELPFEPDVLTIITNDPILRLISSSVAYIEFDFAALGQLAAKAGGSAGSNGYETYINALWTPTTVLSHYKKEGSTVTVSAGKISNSLSNCVFGSNIEYLVVAGKFDLVPLRERIESNVAKLPEQTTSKPVYYQKNKVNSAFTDEEWEALIATRPDYTFSLV